MLRIEPFIVDVWQVSYGEISGHPAVRPLRDSAACRPGSGSRAVLVKRMSPVDESDGV